MNIQAYIESGIVESYVYGLCNEAEALDFERLCALHLELQAELDKTMQAMHNYAQANAKTPPSFIKENIFAQIDELEKPTIHISKVEQAEVIPITKTNNNYWMAAAAVIIVSLIGNVVLYTKWQNANELVLALNSEKSVLANSEKSTKVKLNEYKAEMEIMSDPQVQKIVMPSVDKTRNQMAMVYWKKDTREVFLQIKQLPSPAAGKQYQLWAIVDGKPVDAGVINMNNDTLLYKMKDFGAAQAFAITLENEGGSAQPTLSNLYVMGGV